MGTGARAAMCPLERARAVMCPVDVEDVARRSAPDFVQGLSPAADG